MIKPDKTKLFFLSLLVLSLTSGFGQSGHKFTVILDAGHGGKDPGNSYHGFVEKEIALKTTMKVGKYLEADKDIKVAYTRTSDVFIELVNRPKVANRLKANLFVSIHCNSVKNPEPSGTETFVMGLARSDMNLQVAKSENSVILLEDNHKETYQGFDPKKPESLLGLKIMQEENLNGSIELASKIQDNFTFNLNRKTRGVKQQPLWVLDAASMPGVLIELGFLSNKEEGEFLNSDEGQEKMARQIANAIIAYKKDFYGEGYAAVQTVRQPGSDKPNTQKDSTANAPKNTTAGKKNYQVQLCASNKKIALKPYNFKGLKSVSTTYSNNLYKYFYGPSSTMEEAKKRQQEAKEKGYASAFIVEIN